MELSGKDSCDVVFSGKSRFKLLRPGGRHVVTAYTDIVAEFRYRDIELVVALKCEAK